MLGARLGPGDRVGETGQWWPADGDVIEFAEVTTRDIVASWVDDPVEPSAVVRFTIDSGYPVDLGGGVGFTVFRDANGEIIGGGNDVLSDPVSPGRSRSFGELRAGFAGVVPARDDLDHPRTAVYVSWLRGLEAG